MCKSAMTQKSMAGKQLTGWLLLCRGFSIVIIRATINTYASFNLRSMRDCARAPRKKMNKNRNHKINEFIDEKAKST